MKVKLINNSNYPTPKYQTKGAAGFDLHADIKEDVTIGELERHLVATGIFIELPVGFEAQIRPRSGLAHKNGIGILNSPGTIDSDYRGEIFVNLVNLSKEPFTIKPGERIAQVVVAKHETLELIEVDELSNTQRGEKGFSSTKQ